MTRRKLTPWQRIMRASERGTGLRLSAEDVWRLSMDDAIHTRALLDDEDDAEDEQPKKEQQ